MPTTADLLRAFPSRFRAGKVNRNVSYYFSVGADKFSLRIGPTACEVVEGKIENADCVVKSDPAVFEALVLRGKAPGPIDIARGKFKTNDPSLLMLLKDAFGV